MYFQTIFTCSHIIPLLLTSSYSWLYLWFWIFVYIKKILLTYYLLYLFSGDTHEFWKSRISDELQKFVFDRILFKVRICIFYLYKILICYYNNTFISIDFCQKFVHISLFLNVFFTPYWPEKKNTCMPPPLFLIERNQKRIHTFVWGRGIS